MTWELFDDAEIDAMTVDELRDWVRKLDQMAGDRDRLLQAVPPCPEHGPCIPHAVAWVEQAKDGARSVPLLNITFDEAALHAEDLGRRIANLGK